MPVVTLECHCELYNVSQSCEAPRGAEHPLQPIPYSKIAFDIFHYSAIRLAFFAGIVFTLIFGK